MSDKIKLYNNDGESFDFYIDDTRDLELMPEEVEPSIYLGPLIRNYYKKYGSSNIYSGFTTFDGVTYDQDGYNIGSIDRWEFMYNIARVFYEHYGHLNIPQHFKTYNGVDYNSDGLKLGGWLSNQRFAYKKRIGLVDKNNTFLNPLTNRQVLLLLNIGMVFFLDGNLTNKDVLFELFNIDIENNKFLIGKTYEEIKAKIDYLLSVGKPIQIGSRVHEIFWLSYEKLNKKYLSKMGNRITWSLYR